MLPLLAGALILSVLQPQAAAKTEAPSGWTQLQSDSDTRFFFPRAGDRSTFVAIFPTQDIDGTLERTLSATWHKAIGNERVVDAQEKSAVTSDGAPALMEIVATVDAANTGIYRVFIVKQYGTRVASGELRSDDPAKMQNVGDEALRMLENMRVVTQ